MYCRYCGEKIEDDSVFCNKCGKQLLYTGSADNPQHVTPAIPRTPKLNEKTQEKRIINEDATPQSKENTAVLRTIGLIIIGVLICGIVGVLICVGFSMVSAVDNDDKGVLYITSSPSGATVNIGGIDKGVTPLEIAVSPDVRYSVFITKSGYEMWYKSVSVPSGERKTVSANLVSNTIQPMSTFTPEPTPTPQPTNYDDGYYDRHYTWEYDGREYYLDMQISKSAYAHYKGLSHSNADLAKYATETVNRETSKTIADAIKKYGAEHGLVEFEEVMMAVTFVQSLPYTSDSVTTGHDEYVRYPIETLVDNGGDCEDTAILTAAIIREMGYGAVLLVLPGHAAVGVKGGEGIYGTYWEYDGEKYYYLETTGENFEIGMIPDAHKNEKARVIYIS